jgi:hypothetical protein
MPSKSQEAVETQTTNHAVDERMVVEQGNAIRDSIIQNNDPEVIEASLRPLLAAWEQQSRNGNLNLVELTSLAQKLSEQVAKSQINLSGQAEKQLSAGLKSFSGLLAQNKLNISLIEGVAERASDSTAQALELVADVKTGDFADLSKSIMVFALIALGITTYAMRNK